MLLQQLSFNSYMITIAERLKIAYDRIANAIKKYQKANANVQLLAVSKTKPTTLIREAYAAGQRQFGESYVQEAVEKINQLTELDIEWHFIGPIQSNKSALIAANFSWVQSVDREKIIHRLNEQRPKNLGKLNVLLQVNIDNDEAKSGCKLEDVAQLAALIENCEQLEFRGLMAIPSQSDDENQTAASFAKLKACFDELKPIYSQVDTLSIGMSQDLEIAISQGATMVRIGTDIFGARNYN